MTTTQTEIQIHEFSTGIRPERTADGGWVSLGFTGQYMNTTIDPIPHAIQRSIANKEFGVAEGAARDKPAIIGRVVSGDDSDWSVVALVTKGRDEKGRSASVYRYFFCEGDKGVSNVWRILGWIENYQQLHAGEMPTFNPFDTRGIDQPNLHTTSTPPQFNLLPETEESLLSTSAPILIPPEAQYTLQDINRLANKKAIADDNQQPVAWAYKVEALEQPRRFQIIQAASDKAYELLQKIKATTPQVAAPLVDEQAIKSAIKGLINSSRVKLDYVQAIAEPLENERVTESYWKEIFDGQGATNALKQGIYSPQMVRLLALRAIVIPQTLPEYLGWLGNGSKGSDNNTLSVEFQSQIKNSLIQISDVAKNLEFNVVEGIRLLLPKLLEQKVTVESVVWLLTSTNGLWASFTRQVLQDMDHDLQSMNQSAKGAENVDFNLTDKSWQNIRSDLKKYWQIRHCAPQEKYQTFAELFERLNHYKLSAFFYHVCLGKVDKKIFTKVCSNGWTHKLYGISIERKLAFVELAWLVILKIGSIEVRVPFVIVITLVSLVLGVAGGKFWTANAPETQRSARVVKSTDDGDQPLAAKVSPELEQCNTAVPLVTNNQDGKVKKFYTEGKTYSAIRKIVCDIVSLDNSANNVQKITEKQVTNALNDVLVKRISIDIIQPDTDLSKPQNNQQKVTYLVDQIQAYQKQQSLKSTDGVIDIDKDTYKKLKCDIATKINSKLSKIAEICPISNQQNK